MAAGETVAEILAGILLLFCIEFLDPSVESKNIETPKLGV